MKRTLWTVLVCLAVGAGGMWVASNFRVKFETVGVVEPQPSAAAKAEAPPPELLPPHLQPPPTTGVQPASGTLPLAVGAIATAAGLGATPTQIAAVAAIDASPIEITELLDGTASEAVLYTDLTGPLLLRSNTVTLNFRFANQANLKAKTAAAAGNMKLQLLATAEGSSKPVIADTLSADSTTATFQLTTTEFANKRKVTFTARWVDNTATIDPTPAAFRLSPSRVDASWDVLLPADPAPAITKVYNGRYANPQTSNITLFPGFARVEVTSRRTGAEHTFFLYSDAAAKRTVLATPAVVAATPTPVAGVTEYTLAWDTPVSGNALLLVRETAGGSAHNTHAVPVSVAPAPAPPRQISLDQNRITPVIANTDKTPASPVGGQFHLAADTAKLTVTLESPPAAGRVVLFVDKLVSSFPKSDADAAPNTSISFNSVKFGTDGDHVVTVAFEAGGVIAPNPLVLAVKVRRSGLAVTRVSPTDFSNATDYKVRVAFNPENPVDPASASAKASYTLTLNGTDKSSTEITSDPVPFDPVTNTATLQLNPSLPPGQYTLTVKAAKKDGTGGIKDLYGNPLGRPAGEDGINASASLVQPVGSNQPSQSAGVTLGTGPNVTFPEYTRFRQVPDGFNPSDRVETRVVRLYYSRDAHRIAQIVNRDVKSYNAASVDVRRRAADRSRDDANASTDARKRLEGDAITAATETRAAEAKLRDLQTKLANARNEGATATTQLGQRQQQLEQFQRTFGREQTNVGVRRDTDTSADDAQRRVDRLKADVAQAEAAVTATGKFGPSNKPTDLDAEIVNARNTLNTSQQAFTAAYAAAKADAEKTPAVIAALNKVSTLETARQRPGLSADQLARLDADLAVARQERDTETQNAILRTAAANDLRIKSKAALDDQLAYERLVNARDALTALPTQRLAVADAQRDLDRAKAVAGGRAATDAGADSAQDTALQLQTEIATLNKVVATATANRQLLEADIATATGEVQAKRAREVELTLRVREAEQRELRGREDQFRREVAAAKADPDTYAAGDPNSDDPVRQCSISVIGEGLIQIRGPVKGLNVIRNMINQMDAPTGQVRVGVHTFQVNGEKVERMDRVSANIQRYLDHSRFLTTQSAQMLRKAVTTVASRKAHEASLTLAPGCSKADQEMKYMHSFFGKDFIDELRQLDSEFLRSGNKLLSLHSMDSTSLSAALFLLALAKNDVRHEILAEWQGQLQTKLPEAELAFYTAGLVCADKCEAHCDKKFCVLAHNAKFASFLGFFDAEVQGNDTLNPVQREFVRLAQIFKTRLVTEMELKQRVMERTLLEDRMGDYMQESREAKAREKAAQVELGKFQQAMIRSSAEAEKAVTELSNILTLLRDIQGSVAEDLEPFEKLLSLPAAGLKSEAVKVTSNDRVRTKPVTQGNDVLFKDQADAQTALKNLSSFLYHFKYLGKGYNDRVVKINEHITRATTKEEKLTRQEYNELRDGATTILKLIEGESEQAQKELSKIASTLKDKSADPFQAIGQYNALRDEFVSKLNTQGDLGERIRGIFFNKANPAFDALSKAATDHRASTQIAQLARRPLDEKKLLDMLVDEMEDKYIELLDGTRAHTANVDNYLKALATALDDDFNTQFYQPAMRRIRAVAAVRDVQLGQIESTTVLTNNRVLGKVSPAASMEFDLPRRDIALREAFKASKAAVQDYGALLNDPVFLSLVKAYGGMPPSATFGGAGGGLPAVRNVLPGLPSSADELLMAQAGSPRREFGTNLESLIPDPAIYKFETGTGYEIRPVISPDGQAVVFAFDYMYTTDVREPVRADEKHLGRVKRHFVHTDVQLGNFELREVSKYWVTLKAARTGQGVPLLQDIPGVGGLFRPPPSASSSLQQNLIYSQAAIFPTLFDLMGLRYAPAVADIDPEFTKNDEFVVRGRRDYLRQFIFDYGASRVDDALRIMYGERRPDLYRSQHTIPWVHPNGYQGPGLRQRDAVLEEGYDPLRAYPPTKFAPGMHAPQQPDRDPFGDPGPTHSTGPLTLPGGGHVGWDGFKTPSPPLLSARPPGGVSTAKEYAGQHLGTTVTPEPGPRPPTTPTAPLPVPRAYTPTQSPEPKRTGTVPTVSPPPAERPSPPTPTPLRAAPVEPLPLSPRPGATGSANPYFPR